MSNDAIRLKATSDNKELLKSIEQTQKRMIELEKQLGKTSASSKKLTAEERALGREAKKVMEEVQSPTERYNAKLVKLKTLLEKDKISAEEFGRASVKAKHDMLVAQKKLEEQNKKSDTRVQEATQKQKELAQAGKAVFDQSRTPLQRHNRELGKLKYLYRQGAIGQRTYNAAVRQATFEYNKAAMAQRGAFGRTALAGVRSLTAAFGIGGGLYTAVSLVRGEIDAMYEKWERMKEATKETADPQIAALRNLGASSIEERNKFTKLIADLSERTGVSQEDLYSRASDALSARGDLPVTMAMRAVAASAQIAPESAEIGKPLAGVALDIAKIERGMSPEQAIGFTMGVGQMARVTETGSLAENVAPALTAGVANDASLQNAGALWAAITQGMADPTGRKSGNTTASLTTQLREFLPKVGTMDERLKILQEDPKLRAKFLDDASFEKKAQATVEQILAGEGAAATAYEQFKTRIPGRQRSGEIFREQVGLIAGDEIQKTAAIARDFSTAAKNLELVDQDGARTGVAMGEFQRIIEDAGMPRFAARLTKFGATVSQDEFGELTRLIEQQQKQLESPVVREMYHPMGSPSGYIRERRREPTQVELEHAEVLGNLLERVSRHLAGQVPSTADLFGSDSSGPNPVVQAIERQTQAMKQSNQQLCEQLAAANPSRPVPVERVPEPVPLPPSTATANAIHSE